LWSHFAKRRDRFEQDLAGPKRETELAQVSLGQRW
jgi:hypothetical protein